MLKEEIIYNRIFIANSRWFNCTVIKEVPILVSYYDTGIPHIVFLQNKCFVPFLFST